MSAVSRASRGRRGRVMFVGDHATFSRLAAMLAQPPVHAQNMFEAIGEVMVSPAGAPIVTALVSERCLESNNSRAIEALRKVDPAVRLVLLARNAASAAQWNAPHDHESGALDECIIGPIRPEDVQRLFDQDQLASEPSSIERPSHPSEASGAWELVESENESAAVPEIVVERSAREPAPAPALASGATPPPKAARPPHSQRAAAIGASPPDSPVEIIEHGLGDTDLLQAMLETPSQLREVALRLIAQQTGWRDIALTPTPPSQRRQPGTADAVEVGSHSNRHGWLSAGPPATGPQLKSWADWLAKWLAFDQAYQQSRCEALQDELTGAWNRRYFEKFLTQAIAHAAKTRRSLSLMVFDLDNFKSYNDEFGHEAGDEILRETVRLLQSVIRQGDRVCRIGGDEFVVVFGDPEGPRAPGSQPPESVEVIAKRFQDQVCTMRFPKLGVEAPGTISISAGLATYPWDGADARSLLRHADQLALESKRRGKNALTLGKGAQMHCDAAKRHTEN